MSSKPGSGRNTLGQSGFVGFRRRFEDEELDAKKPGIDRLGSVGNASPEGLAAAKPFMNIADANKSPLKQNRDLDSERGKESRSSGARGSAKARRANKKKKPQSFKKNKT